MSTELDNLRSMMATIRDEYRVGANTAKRVGDTFLAILPFLGSFLSKVDNDEAQGIVTFLKGILLGSERSHGLTAEGDASLAAISFDDVLKSLGAAQGFHDGHGVYMDASQGLIETDGLNVRGFMRVMELIVNRLQLMESDYSFTEGDTVVHIDYEDNGQTLVLSMKKDHDNDYTPFYEGDILYGKVNDLLPHGAVIPEGHIAAENGSFYTTWLRVKSVDLASNKIRVELYEGQLPDGTLIVPGGINFSPAGTPIKTEVTTPMLAEYTARSGEGYDTMLALTRHGNVAGSSDADVRRSQLGRQTAWVLSTTDRSFVMYKDVDSPIITKENVALALGILPGVIQEYLGGNYDFSRPSVWLDTVFADHTVAAHVPARVIKNDRGTWTSTPSEAYHYMHPSEEVWQFYRNSTDRRYRDLTDAELLNVLINQVKVDLEVSRVWHLGKLWECRKEGTSEEPSPWCSDWVVVSGNTAWGVEFDVPPVVMVDGVEVEAVADVLWGDEDMTERLLAMDGVTWTWTRQSGDGGTTTAADELWTPTTGETENVLLIEHKNGGREDCGPEWKRRLKVQFTLTVTMPEGAPVDGVVSLG